VHFGGKEYSCVAEAGDSSLPENQARALFERLDGLRKAYLWFLSEVELDTVH
jgi:hypothetical protein